MHAKASIDGTVIAETDKFEFVEGNVYFPPESLVNKDEFLTPSSDSHTTHCPWKGDSQYYDIHVNGKTFANAAWYYPQPLDKATHLRDYVAFYKTKVQVEKDGDGSGQKMGMMSKVKNMFKS